MNPPNKIINLYVKYFCCCCCRSLERASEESNKQLINLPNGYKLAVIFNLNVVTNTLALRFGMLSDSCGKIWEKKEKNKKKDKNVPVEKRPEDDQLPELRKQAEMTLSALEELKESIMPRGCIELLLFNADNVRGAKVRIEVFYKKVKDMKELKYQVTLEKILKATVDFCRNLFKLSKTNGSLPRRRDALSCTVFRSP